MGWLSFLWRGLGPIVLEHGGQVLRTYLKGRERQIPALPPAGPDPVQQLSSEVEQLKDYILQLRAEIETLNNVVAAREERLRRWLLALLVWNVVLMAGMIVAALALRH